MDEKSERGNPKRGRGNGQGTDTGVALLSEALNFDHKCTETSFLDFLLNFQVVCDCVEVNCWVGLEK